MINASGPRVHPGSTTTGFSQKPFRLEREPFQTCQKADEINDRGLRYSEVFDRIHFTEGFLLKM